ncbi:MAG: NmrA family NAD(P)-binding protein, partial [Bryobacteraceae bacterium]
PAGARQQGESDCAVREQRAAWRERGAEVAIGSLDDRAFLSTTLAGAAGFFALMPPDATAQDFYGAQRQTADAIAGGVADSPVPYVVMLSSIGAELAEGTGPIKGLHYMEGVLRGTGVKLIAVRAGFFQENIADLVKAARLAGIYPNFMPSPDFAVPMIATKDIGHLASKLLLSPPAASDVVDLVGPAYTGREISEKLSAALGKPLHIVDIPAAGHVEALKQAGVPPAAAEALAELYAALGTDLLQPHGDRTVAGATPIDELIGRLVAAA